MKNRYTIKVGVFGRRYITVTAANRDEALSIARQRLDAREEKKGQEPPVAWDLNIVAVNHLQIGGRS